VTDDSPTVAVVQRVLSAAPGDVYAEWLDAEGMAEWMCPRPARPTKIELDPRIGGRLLIDIEDEGVELSITGEYLELDQPRRLSFSWSCSTWVPPATSIVTVTLEPHGDEQTLMTIHHAHVPPELVDGHQRGWTLIADQLDRHLAGSSPQ
jgi:uncharacterized protein YndB with AHSA1/START domain